jgi:hypothetical protein
LKRPKRRHVTNTLQYSVPDFNLSFGEVRVRHAGECRHSGRFRVRILRGLDSGMHRNDGIGVDFQSTHSEPLGLERRIIQFACRRMNAVMVSMQRIVSGLSGDGTMRCSGNPSNVCTSIEPPRLRYEAIKRSCISSG